MRGKWVLVGAAVLVTAGAVAAWIGRGTYQTAQLGTVYVAKQTCSCLFVARRKIDSCKTDYDPAAIEPLSLDIGPSSVTVSAFGGWLSARSEFEEGYGCHPAN
jgi:hypothetical protein